MTKNTHKSLVCMFSLHSTKNKITLWIARISKLTGVWKKQCFCLQCVVLTASSKSKHISGNLCQTANKKLTLRKSDTQKHGDTFRVCQKVSGNILQGKKLHETLLEIILGWVGFSGLWCELAWWFNDFPVKIADSLL